MGLRLTNDMKLLQILDGYIENWKSDWVDIFHRILRNVRSKNWMAIQQGTIQQGVLHQEIIHQGTMYQEDYIK